MNDSFFEEGIKQFNNGVKRFEEDVKRFEKNSSNGAHRSFQKSNLQVLRMGLDLLHLKQKTFGL